MLRRAGNRVGIFAVTFQCQGTARAIDLSPDGDRPATDNVTMSR